MLQHLLQALGRSQDQWTEHPDSLSCSMQRPLWLRCVTTHHALRRCAKAACNAMGTGCLMTNAWWVKGESLRSCAIGKCQGTSACILTGYVLRLKRMHASIMKL